MSFEGMEQTRRTRKEGCLSNLRLDRLVRGALGEEEVAAARAHLATCGSCAARCAEVERERAEFQASAPQRSEAETTAAILPAWWAARWVAPAALLAAAALVFLVARPKGEGMNAGLEETRVKGKARLGFVVESEGRLRPGADGEEVRPGDRLQFTVTSPSPRFVAVLSVDGARAASVYAPDGPRAVRINPGTSVALPRSTVLDAALGRETLYGLFCDGPVELEPLRRALAARPDEAPAFPGCQVDRLVIDKRAGTDRRAPPKEERKPNDVGTP